MYHGLGSGKTCTCALIMDDWMKSHDGKVWFLSPGSLRENFIDQYCSFCGENRVEDVDRIQTLSYNYSRLPEKIEEMELGEDINIFDNCLVIIDEVHNLINGKVNGSKTYSFLYDHIDEAANVNIVLLSGTPIVSSSMDVYFVAHLLDPVTYSSEQGYLDRIGLDEDQVIVPTAPEVFVHDLIGLVSHVVIADGQDDESMYPSVTFENIVVPMNSDRREAYRDVRHQEISVKPPSESQAASNPALYQQLRARYYLAVSMVRSRQLSNFWYPIIERNGVSGTPHELGLSDHTVEKGGWVDSRVLSMLPRHGEKIAVIIENILNNPGKHVIYTEFKRRGGAWLISAILDAMKIPNLLFTGDLDDAGRHRVLETFNSKENMRGEKVKVLIVTDAGAQGINLTEVRYFHTLEQYITSWIIEQAYGRAVRYGSHQRLPKEERNVTIFNYLIEVGNDELSSDMAAMKMAGVKKHAIGSLVKVVTLAGQMGMESMS